MDVGIVHVAFNNLAKFLEEGGIIRELVEVFKCSVKEGKIIEGRQSSALVVCSSDNCKVNWIVW